MMVGISPGTILYVVCAVQSHQTAEMSVFNFRGRLKLTWADGMIGVLPVFSDKEKAEEYADGKFEVMEVSAIKVMGQQPQPNTSSKLPIIGG